MVQHPAYQAYFNELVSIGLKELRDEFKDKVNLHSEQENKEQFHSRFMMNLEHVLESIKDVLRILFRFNDENIQSGKMIKDIVISNRQNNALLSITGAPSSTTAAPLSISDAPAN